ncbi:MAG: hypothetical protein RL190_212, partial [Actinomycetota bacterium]
AGLAAARGPSHAGPPWFVLSTIRTGDRPLSYSPVRSVFSPGERLAQTLETIASIRVRCAPAPIVVLDASNPGSRAIAELQHAGATAVALPTGSAVGRAVASPHKGLGEAMLLLTAMASHAASDGLWKISGRYTLIDTPSPAAPSRFAGRWRGDDLSTVCFGVPADLVEPLRDDLLASLPRLAAGASIEAVLSGIVRSRGLATDPSPPVTGLVAVDGTRFAT